MKADIIFIIFHGKLTNVFSDLVFLIAQKINILTIFINFLFANKFKSAE
jgi:hypothetical protein